jgi:DNA polymerase III delta prime subunit
MLPLHESIREELLRQVQNGGQTFLLLGGDGVGKKTIISRVLESIPCQKTIYNEFKVEHARQLKSVLTRMSAERRCIVVDGDHANDNAFNAILKTLEEPPANVVIFITCSSTPLTTVVSRCYNLHVPRLTDAELMDVLMFIGMSERVAISVIPHSCGSVSEAKRVYERLQAKEKMLPYLKALRDGDADFVFRQTRQFDKLELDLLRELVGDMLMSRYGLRYPELAQQLPVPIEFIDTVKAALNAGRSPGLCWLRAWFATR